VSATNRAAELRALADKLDAKDVHDEESEAAKAAYSEALASGDEDLIAEAKARHRAASDALAAVRAESGNFFISVNTPGSKNV
jgi:hypothetical protein